MHTHLNVLLNVACNTMVQQIGLHYVSLRFHKEAGSCMKHDAMNDVADISLCVCVWVVVGACLHRNDNPLRLCIIQ